jgi:hypothetical protein
MVAKYSITLVAGAMLLTVLSCTRVDDREGMHFTLLPASETGISFSNTITENDSLNMFVNEYTYMCGGGRF